MNTMVAATCLQLATLQDAKQTRGGSQETQQRRVYASQREIQCEFVCFAVNLKNKLNLENYGFMFKKSECCTG